MGCSLLSGVEMIYYLTVGLFYRTKPVARSMTVRKSTRIEDLSTRKGRVEGGNKIKDINGKWTKDQEGSPDLNIIFGINQREWGYHKRHVVKQRF